MEDIHEAMAIFNLQRAIDSYPRLDNLQYFRELNLFIENTFNEKLEETGGSNKRGQITFERNQEPKEKLLNLHEFSEEKKYKSFQNLVRPSLLITLCSFIENIFTYRVNSNKELKKKFDALKKSKNKEDKGSDLNQAKKVLIDIGFKELDNIKGTKFVDDMNWIRNKFVHNKGEVEGKEKVKMKKLTSQYDFEVEEKTNHIILGEKFIENYITHLEKFAVEVAKIIYKDESWVHEMLQKYPKLVGSTKKIQEFMRDSDITVEELIRMSSIEISNRR